MGRDVVGFVEIRRNTRWEPIFDLGSIRRNYRFFRVLGDIGVNGYPCILPNKGMPSDASEETRNLYDEFYHFGLGFKKTGNLYDEDILNSDGEYGRTLKSSTGIKSWLRKINGAPGYTGIRNWQLILNK